MSRFWFFSRFWVNGEGRKEGRKNFRSLKVRRKLIALKKGCSFRKDPYPFCIYSCKLHLQTQVELQLSRCHVVSSSLRLVRKCRRFHSNWTRLIHLLVPFLVRDSTWGLLVSFIMNQNGLECFENYLLG